MVIKIFLKIKLNQEMLLRMGINKLMILQNDKHHILRVTGILILRHQIVSL